MKTRKEIAAEAGINGGWLSSILTGNRKTTNIDLAIRIEDASEGQIKAVQIVPQLQRFTDAAWKEGYNKGQEEGRAEGYLAGKARGLIEGRLEGRDQVLAEARSFGKNKDDSEGK